MRPLLARSIRVGPRQHVEVLHDRGQRHRERLRQLADGLIVALRQLLENGPPRRVRQGGERAIEPFVVNVNHVVKYLDMRRRVKRSKPERIAPTISDQSDASVAQQRTSSCPNQLRRNLSPRASAMRRCSHLGSNEGCPLERATLRAARAGGRATVTRFEPVHPGRWGLGPSSRIPARRRGSVSRAFLVSVRWLSEPRALTF